METGQKVRRRINKDKRGNLLTVTWKTLEWLIV